jgi:hypothetical protein
MSWDTYAATYDALFDPFGPDRDPARLYGDWGAALDREMTPALREVFTSPDATVLYGSFSDARTRVALDGEGRPVLDGQGMAVANSFDNGQGLRVVWQLERQTPARRLISVITFWRFDAASGRPVPVGGFDALRIRSQLVDYVSSPEDADPQNHTKDAGHGFAGLSYQASVADGVVTGLVPSPPVAFAFDPATTPPEQHPTIAGIALPVACAACHRGHFNRMAGRAALPASQAESRDLYLRYVEGLGVSADAVAALRAEMSAPETMRALFLPNGILSTLDAKCGAP